MISAAVIPYLRQRGGAVCVVVIVDSERPAEYLALEEIPIGYLDTSGERPRRVCGPEEIEAVVTRVDEMFTRYIVREVAIEAPEGDGIEASRAREIGFQVEMTALGLPVRNVGQAPSDLAARLAALLPKDEGPTPKDEPPSTVSGVGAVDNRSESPGTVFHGRARSFPLPEESPRTSTAEPTPAPPSPQAPKAGRRVAGIDPGAKYIAVAVVEALGVEGVGGHGHGGQDELGPVRVDGAPPVLGLGTLGGRTAVDGTEPSGVSGVHGPIVQEGVAAPGPHAAQPTPGVTSPQPLALEAPSLPGTEPDGGQLGGIDPVPTLGHDPRLHPHFIGDAHAAQGSTLARLVAHLPLTIGRPVPLRTPKVIMRGDKTITKTHRHEVTDADRLEALRAIAAFCAEHDIDEAVVETATHAHAGAGALLLRAQDIGGEIAGWLRAAGLPVRRVSSATWRAVAKKRAGLVPQGGSNDAGDDSDRRERRGSDVGGAGAVHRREDSGARHVTEGCGRGACAGSGAGVSDSAARIDDGADGADGDNDRGATVRDRDGRRRVADWRPAVRALVSNLPTLPPDAREHMLDATGAAVWALAPPEEKPVPRITEARPRAPRGSGKRTSTWTPEKAQAQRDKRKARRAAEGPREQKPRVRTCGKCGGPLKGHVKGLPCPERGATC